MFQAYFKALKPGGSVVIDSISSFSEYYRSLSRVEKQRISWAFRQQVINGEPLNFKSIFPNPPGQIEESTVDKLENLHPHVWQILSRWWDIQDVGSEKTQVRVLIKKS